MKGGQHVEQQFNYEALIRLNQKRRKKTWKRIVSVLMCIVVFCTTYMLILPAITKETKTYCGISEHIHEDACYRDVSQCQIHVHADTCFADDDTLICEEADDPEHVHSDACNGKELICSEEEHSHSRACLSDPAADLENEEMWKATLPTLTEISRQSVIEIARSQLSYSESSDNYLVDDDGSLRGYTRYGDWYGNPYGDWNAMFAAFCLHYAGVSIPYDASSSAWAKALEEQERLMNPSEYIPKVGDIVFFDTDTDGTVDRVGLIDTIEDINITTIEGDLEGLVGSGAYDLFDKHIAGYGAVDMFIGKPNMEEPETEASTNVPETEASTNVPETEASTDVPETEASTDVPETEASTNVPETDPITDTPESEPSTDAPEADPSVSTSDKQAALADLIPPENTPTQQPYSLRNSGTASPSAYSMRHSAATYQIQPRNTPIELTPFIINVLMYDSAGKLITNGSTVTEDDMIEFKIEYTITGQKLAVMGNDGATVISNSLTYKVPEIFEIISSKSGDIPNSVGNIVGSYVIDGSTGTITMTFLDDYVNQNASGMQIHGFISFFSQVVKITDADKENQEYKFTDDITLGVVIKEKREAVGDIKIEKSYSKVDGEYITYEIKVSSTEGTNGPVTITDTMSKGLTFAEGISVKKANGTTVSDAVFNASSDKSSYTMTLPEMNAGDSYTIKYKCHADIAILDADMTVHNTASVNTKDSEDFELEDKVTVDYTFEVLKKTGKLNDDGTITWTITVNHAKVDISGWTLTDIMGGSTEYTGEVTISDSSGKVLAQNARLPYTFPSGSKDTYVITYTTTHGYSDGDEIFNKAILSYKDTDITVVTGVGVGTPFTKSGEAGELIQDENGTYLLPITWTVTIDTSNGSIPAGEVIYDKMNGEYHQADMYMTYDQVMAAISAIEAALQHVGSQVSYASAETFVAGYNVGTNYNRDKLTDSVNYPECESLLYERFSVKLGKEIPKGIIITFSYQSYGIFPDNLVEESVFKNRIGLSGEYEIETSVKYTAGKVKATKYAMKPYNPNSTISQDWALDWNPSVPTKYEYSQLYDSYLAWAINLSVPAGYTGNDDVIIYEDLPDGITVKGLDLPFLLDMPTKRLTMRNMIPGNIYEWTFKLYPLEQYVSNWGYKDGVDTTITVEYTLDGDLIFTIPGIVFKSMGQFIEMYNTTGWSAPFEETYGYLYIYTQINDDFEWTPRSEGSQVYVDYFENKFTIKNQDGDIIDIGSQTQVITKDESKDAIRKEATVDNNNIITYSVILNTYGKDLIKNSSTLHIHDELTYTSPADTPIRVRLVPGSLKLYEIRVASDGSYTKLGEVTAEYSYAESSTEQGTNTAWIHTIDLTVPDSKALLLEYSYKASGTKNAAHSVLNSCSISGVGSGSIDGDHKLEITVKEATAQADTEGVMLYKVDADSDGIFLKNVKFNIYIWNEDIEDYIIVNHPNGGGTDFVTDANGMIVLDTSTIDNNQFAYNTAYYLVEVESPEGYFLGPERYYFYIANDDTVKYPECIPENFTGRALVSGDIIYRKNVSEITKIMVEKYWQDNEGKSVTVTEQQVSSVTLELWQMLDGQPSSAKLYDTYTMTPDEKGNWSLTITGLPKATKKSDGTKGTDYLYFIKEVGVGGYTLESSENNSGINSGTIKLTNRKTEGYVLPETGGIGTEIYTKSGLLLILISTAFLMKKFKKRRKEDYSP